MSGRKSLTSVYSYSFTILTLVILEVVIFVNSGFGQDYDSIPITRWVDPEGRQPLSYLQWQARIEQPGPFTSELVYKSAPLKDDDSGKCCLVVNDSLYPLIQTLLDQYITDLTAEGYEVEVHTSSGGTYETFRQFLQVLYADGMEGCVLIGDLPVAWYEADCSESEVPDIADITRIIDYLYLSHLELCCLEEADVDGSGGEPDISDITCLIDHLYQTHEPLPDCL